MDEIDKRIYIVGVAVITGKRMKICVICGLNYGVQDQWITAYSVENSISTE